MEYNLVRSCVCGTNDTIPLSKREAAFDLYDSEAIWNKSCPVCGATKASCVGVNKPDFDLELLLDWGNDASLFFYEQDEDLMLAEEQYLDLILEVIDKHVILEEKRAMLISALTVIVYNNLPEFIKKESNPELIESRNKARTRAKEELLKRKELLISSNEYIWGYIKRKVFPELGLKYKK